MHAVLKKAELIRRDLGRDYLAVYSLAFKLFYRAHVIRGAFAVLGTALSGLGAYLELALSGVIGSGNDHGLPRRRDEELQQRLLVARIIKHFAVHGQSRLPVLIVHESKQLAQLS